LADSSSNFGAEDQDAIAAGHTPRDLSEKRRKNSVSIESTDGVGQEVAH